MVDLEIIVAVLAFMIYNAYLDAYKVHSGDEKEFNNLLINTSVLHYTHDRD